MCKDGLSPDGWVAENPPTSPITKADEIINRVELVKQEINKLVSDREDLQSCKATLALNCQEGRELHKCGCTYAEDQTVHWNMFFILSKLTDKIRELTQQVEDLRHDKQ